MVVWLLCDNLIVLLEYNYTQANQIGCHIITIPPAIIEKIQKFGKSFDQLTQETVKNFLIDSRKSKFKL